MISVIACLTFVSSPASNGEIPSSSSRRPGVLSRSAALSFRPAPRRSEPGQGCLDPPQDLRVGRYPVRGARHPGRGKYLIKAGERLGIPVELSLVGAEHALYDTDQAIRAGQPRRQG